MKPVLIITGPTAVGKTELSLQIAERLGNAEIISVDSRQIYRHMDIGTAKPTPAEQKRVLHHFIDFKNPNESYSAGEFGKAAREKVLKIWSEDKVAILVGGSGLYIQAFLDGLFPEDTGLEKGHEELIERLKGEGTEALYSELESVDPLACEDISKQDGQRIIRLLSINYNNLEKSIDRRKVYPFNCLPIMVCLDRDRDHLYQRIDERVDKMMKSGLIEEVEELLNRGYGRDCPALGTLGYAEMIDYLEETRTIAEARERIKTRTRKYAKRQWTWFRRDRRYRWLALDTWRERGVIDRIMAQYNGEKVE